MIDYPAILSKRRDYPPCTFTTRDTLLYALSLGLGGNPTDPAELAYVFERDLVALPTMACVIGAHSIKDLNLGVDYTQIVHGAQELKVFGTIPAHGEFSSSVQVASVVDRGPGKGAIVNVRRLLRDEARQSILAETLMSVICRADGGFGGPSVTPRPAACPDRSPDIEFEQVTSPQSALLYRLNGDLNPLHADPEVAARAGFDRPILHGLATFGMAGRAIVSRLCDAHPERMRTLSARFRAPVYPGDRLRTQMWREPGGVSFRTLVADRQSVALDCGTAEIND